MTTPNALQELMDDAHLLCSNFSKPDPSDPLFRKKMNSILANVNDFYEKHWYTFIYVNDYMNPNPEQKFIKTTTKQKN